LPADLINFLHITDGMHMVWTARMATPTGELAPLGSLYVHSLAEMRTVHCPAIPEDVASAAEDPTAPRDGHLGDVVELDKCGGDGTVGLVYPADRGDGPPSVWFSDRSGMWYWVASSFTEYVKMMTIHLGLPGWQYAFTDIGLSPISQQWFSVYVGVDSVMGFPHALISRLEGTPVPLSSLPTRPSRTHCFRLDARVLTRMCQCIVTVML
jgi:tubulin polyglutamylase complex subunit 2